jgi:aldose 1-epimerase
MSFQVRSEPGPGGPDTPSVVLEGGGARAAVSPAHGFNCYSWQVPPAPDLLYCDPQQLAPGGRPTRVGIPILFPFPNRIRDGRFTWDGQEYQLPRNDPPQKNAIHGFACRRPWRVVDQGADADAAWVTGEFQGSTDAADARGLWPADYRLQVTYRLEARSLRIEAEVDNPDTRPLPFGLGYHPYFRVPFRPGENAADYRVSVPAHTYWELQETLPTGRRLPLADCPGCDLRSPRRFAELKLDDILTDVPGLAEGGTSALAPRGLIQAPDGAALHLRASCSFREVVAFTPPHRQAVSLEPYTCITDAINLQQRGVDAGLLVLQPGDSWGGIVEFAFQANP